MRPGQLCLVSNLLTTSQFCFESDKKIINAQPVQVLLKFGRIGDSPIIGAGTYANNATCAVSCTGSGEFFIRGVVAYDVSCLMEYKGLSLNEAASEVIHKRILEIGGDGGLIAVDAKGNIAMPFNTEGMYRAFKTSEGNKEISIYK